MRKIGNLLMMGVLLAVIIGAAVIISNITGTVDIYLAQQAARQAEAEAERLQAEVELTRAQAAAETAAGERAVLEAAARAVDADRQLVTWYTLRGDVRGALVVATFLGLIACGIVIAWLIGRWGDAQDTTHHDH
jgi:hypothetical protein